MQKIRITENDLKKIITEALKRIEFESLDIENEFNFNENAQNFHSNRWQYIDYAFNIASTVGGRFRIDENNNLSYPEPQVTLPIDEVRKQMWIKARIEGWQIDEHVWANGIQLIFIIPQFGQNEKIIKDAMRPCGWTFSMKRFNTDENGFKWAILSFDPMFQQDVSNEMRMNAYLYHWSPLYNYKSIKQTRLEPRSSNDEYSYPPRVHLIKGDYLTDKNDLIAFGRELCGVNKNPNNDGKYVLFAIATSKIPRDNECFYDPRYEGGYYFKKPIPAEAIQALGGYDFVNDKWLNIDNQ